MQLDKGITLDILDTNTPALSATSDIPVIETHPDSVNKPEVEAKPEATEAAPEEGKTAEESAAPEQPESTSASAEEPEKKPAKGVQKRLDELVKQREDAKRELEAERAEKLRLLSLLEERNKPAQTTEEVQAQEPVRPLRDNYADDATYDAAIDAYTAEKAALIARREVEREFADRAKREQETKAQTEAESARLAYVDRVTKATEKYPDYKTVAESPDVIVSVPMAHAIAHAEDGPDIAYYLGSHPDEAKRIAALAPPLQLMELGAISTRLKAPAASKPVSAAPAPGKPIKASTETAPSPEEESMDQYAARRRKELAAERRPGVRH